MEKHRVFDTYETMVDIVEEISPRNKHLRFKLKNGKTMSFKAGQFVQIFVPIPGEEKPRRTSYSIASSPEFHDYFELCVTHVEGGRSSTYIHNLKVGDSVTVMGPLGKFILPELIDFEPVFIATGSGIAPFRSMILDLLQKKFSKKIYLIFGNRYDQDILYEKQWQQLQNQHSNLSVRHTLSRPEKWTGPRGYVQEQIEQFVPDLQAKHYFICGLSKMINSVNDKLLALGVPNSHIHFEKYD